MKQNPSNRDKYFWKNLVQGFVIYIGSGILASIMFTIDTPPHTPPNWISGFGIVNFIATIYLIFRIALDFTNTAFPQSKDR